MDRPKRSHQCIPTASNRTVQLLRIVGQRALATRWGHLHLRMPSRLRGCVFPDAQVQCTFGITHFSDRLGPLGLLEEPLVQPCKGCPAYIGLLRTGPTQGRSMGGVVARPTRTGPDPPTPSPGCQRTNTLRQADPRPASPLQIASFDSSHFPVWWRPQAWTVRASHIEVRAASPGGNGRCRICRLRQVAGALRPTDNQSGQAIPYLPGGLATI